MKIKILFYKSNRGEEVVMEYINSLNLEVTSAIKAFLLKFQNNDNYRKMPYCRKVREDIFEIRIKIKDEYRILFAYIIDDAVVLLHAFKKKTNKIPKKELKLAISRLKLYD